MTPGEWVAVGVAIAMIVSVIALTVWVGVERQKYAEYMKQVGEALNDLDGYLAAHQEH